MRGLARRRWPAAALVAALAAAGIIATSPGDAPCADAEPVRATTLLRDRPYVIPSPRTGETVRIGALPADLRDQNSAGVGPDEEDAVVVTVWTSAREPIDGAALLASFASERRGARRVTLAGVEGRLASLANSALAIGTIGECSVAVVHGPNEELVRSVARDLTPSD